jgi:hypothetical protein
VVAVLSRLPSRPRCRSPITVLPLRPPPVLDRVSPSFDVRVPLASGARRLAAVPSARLVRLCGSGRFARA